MERLQIEKPREGEKVIEGLYRDIARRITSSPKGLCPVDMTLNFLRVCHAQSCGKCTPCRIGLGQLADLIEDVLDGAADEATIDLIGQTAAHIMDTADCAIGFEAARLVHVGVLGFRDDFLNHATHGNCLYGVEQSIPCMASCPAHVDVPGYVALVKEGRNTDAVALIRKDNPFPSVCGYVCEHPCEKSCRRHMVDDAVNICGIKRYAVDHATEQAELSQAEPTGKTVAVVGGGPGGLTAAYYLSLMGHAVTVYEQRDRLGGMLRYGIPDYRLPQSVLDNDIDFILKTGIKVKTGVNVGEDIGVEELKKEYDALYLSIGAHDDRKLGIDGEDARNVVPAVSMLRQVGEGHRPDLAGKRVCVVGGGNVAMDATRTALRLGAADVKCVYRRRIADMTALSEEIEEAQAEGGNILTLYAPDHIEKDGDGKVSALWVRPQIIGAVGSDGRPSVSNADTQPVRIACDYIVVAIGQSIHSHPFEESGMETRRGAFKAERSSFVPGSGNVFAGGDAVSGPATVILAVAAGKVAADNIDDFLGFDHKISSDVEIPQPVRANFPPCGRVNLRTNDIGDIVNNFSLVSAGMTDEEAAQECSRCLRCDQFGFGSFRKGRVMEW